MVVVDDDGGAVVVSGDVATLDDEQADATRASVPTTIHTARNVGSMAQAYVPTHVAEQICYIVHDSLTSDLALATHSVPLPRCNRSLCNVCPGDKSDCDTQGRWI